MSIQPAPRFLFNLLVIPYHIGEYSTYMLSVGYLHVDNCCRLHYLG